ncbi:DUF2285 domain-containing protein [Sphingomonas sp. G-3-2-10]|uniref:DNA -binding domain-containing protein n=1 Tax=Sphingomonas sp. G-3-2-10 TaxID=2728838 RepID=UPI00146B5CF8|nr:DUF2285 domain-containing protein [Sphingomonas sp. G-3-2-10]NML06774.1 DUF2285 domain-containing protein [Sphingomonas sp. G-3-2-10]
MPEIAAFGFAKHDRADFAQEFLRRNTAYRVAWAALHGDVSAAEALAEARRWGLVRLFDPDRTVRTAPAIWRADCAAQIVSLIAAPGNFAWAATLPVIAIIGEFDLAGDHYLVFDIAGVRHRFRLVDGRRGALAILLPPVANALGAAACDAARRMFLGLSTADALGTLRPSVLQRQRLALLLRVLDASLLGASNREIGTQIVYPWLAGTDAVAWKAMSERRRVQRLVDEARGLAVSGYRDLLRG